MSMSKANKENLTSVHCDYCKKKDQAVVVGTELSICQPNRQSQGASCPAGTGIHGVAKRVP